MDIGLWELHQLLPTDIFMNGIHVFKGFRKVIILIRNFGLFFFFPNTVWITLNFSNILFLWFYLSFGCFNKVFECFLNWMVKCAPTDQCIITVNENRQVLCWLGPKNFIWTNTRFHNPKSGSLYLSNRCILWGNVFWFAHCTH